MGNCTPLHKKLLHFHAVHVVAHVGGSAVLDFFDLVALEPKLQNAPHLKLIVSAIKELELELFLHVNLTFEFVDFFFLFLNDVTHLLDLASCLLVIVGHVFLQQADNLLAEFTVVALDLGCELIENLIKVASENGHRLFCPVGHIKRDGFDHDLLGHACNNLPLIAPYIVRSAVVWLR